MYFRNKQPYKSCFRFCGVNLNISCIKINAIFTKSTVNILNISLSNTGEYQDNRPIQRRDMDSETLDV